VQEKYCKIIANRDKSSSIFITIIVKYWYAFGASHSNQVWGKFDACHKSTANFDLIFLLKL